MFISNEEAEKRKRSSHNVLTVIRKDGDSDAGEAHTREPEVIYPDEILPAEDSSCASAIAAGIDAPSGALLRKMCGLPVSGRKRGQPNMPLEMQAAVATAAQLSSTRAAADVFGTSYHHADELKHGYTNQADRYDAQTDPDKDLAAVINKQKKDVRDLAFQKLTKTLGLISDEKLNIITDATKLGRLAKDLAGVVDKVLPKEATNVGGVHFHVWRPDMKTESEYEVVSVGGQR